MNLSQDVISSYLHHTLLSIDIKPPNHDGAAAAVNKPSIKQPICKY
jgi:hypothetical protein